MTIVTLSFDAATPRPDAIRATLARRVPQSSDVDRPTEPDELPRFAELNAEYEILRELGRGGTAVVYLARDRELGREVAIKVIRAAYVEDEEATARLVREAQTLAQLQHPNIVALYGTRHLRDRSLALIMEYVPGHTLKSEVRQRGQLPHAEVIRVLSEIARGLAYAHRQRIVHRDIKPENIYIDEDTRIARLSDFGIARPWDTDSGLTLPGTAIGTPTYMSPEQIDGGRLDGRSDLYSLGLVGYEMLTGRRPWAGESLYSIVYKQKHEDLPSLAEQRPDVPRNLLVAVEGALRKEPDDRWPDADAFLKVLGQPVAPTAGTSPQPLSADADPDSVTIKYVISAVGPPPPPMPAPAHEAPPPAAPALELAREALQAGPPQAAPLLLVPEPLAFDDDDDPQIVGIAPRRLVLGRPAPLVAALVALLVLGGLATITFSPWGRPARAEPRESAPETPAPVAAPSLPEPGPLVLKPVAAGGDAQEGVAGDTLNEPLVLRVADAAGRPARNAAVRFVVRTGSGKVVPAEGRTDAEGVITARWLPLTPGTHVLDAVLEEGGAAATFRARVAPRPASQLRAASGTGQRGTAGSALPRPLVVRAEDDDGSPMRGVAVRFEVRSGGGRVSPDEVVTAADGTARAQWVLGEGEEQEVVAVLDAADSVSVSFLASGAPPPLSVRRGVAAGGTHSCSLSSDGTAVCWGGNATGQLGDGSSGRRPGSVRVIAAEPLAALSAGISHTCGIGVSGAAYCWGTNTGGQLGDGSQRTRAQPVRVSTGTRLTNVTAGLSHSCALDAAGSLFCWGKNAHGQLGDGTRTDRSAPVRAGGNRTFRSVTVGWSHTCALTTGGTAMCWGRNSLGELGDGSKNDRAQPTTVSGRHRFTALAAGSSHTCGLRSDGTVLCWGQNANGQLGTGDTDGRTSPAAVLSEERFSAITAGGVHTCGLTRDGTAWCWGRNTYGQLGDGSTEDRTRPTMVAGARRFTTIAASGAHTCATAAGGGDFCWGLNLDGQLGDGTRSNQTRPVAAGRR